MKKKSFGILGTTVAAAMAAGFGLVSSPSGQQLVEQAAQQAQITQQAPAQRTVAQQNNGVQTGQRVVVNNAAINPYVPASGGGLLYGNPGMSPKEYGEWLCYTGKDKHNKRCRKHWAKAHS